MKNIGYWTANVGDYNNRLIYLLAFEDSNQRDRAWESFRADPEWLKVVAASEAQGSAGSPDIQQHADADGLFTDAVGTGDRLVRPHPTAEVRGNSGSVRHHRPRC